MSTDTAGTITPGGTEPTGTPPAGGDGFRPITTQTDLDRIIGERVARERNKFSDYDELKTRATTAATRVNELEGQLSTAQAAADAVPIEVTKALRTHLVNVHKLGDDDAALLDTAGDTETLLKLTARLTQGAGGPLVPGEGTPPPPPPVDPKRAFLRDLMGEEGNPPPA